MSEHRLHEVIGSIIREDGLPHCRILRAPECGGSHNLPLFYTAQRSNATEFTNVDMLILKASRVRIVIEIEEKVTGPRLLLGKFLAPALCWGYIHGPTGEDAPMGKQVAFIQIVNAASARPGSSKPHQWRNVEKAIRKIIPVKDSSFTDYSLFIGHEADFRGQTGTELLAHIQTLLES